MKLKKAVTGKLKSRRGETLTEVLVSMLIVVMSALMLATMVVSAASINKKANDAVEKVYEELAAAEAKAAVDSNGFVTVGFGGMASEITVNVDYYGGGNALTAYSRTGVI